MHTGTRVRAYPEELWDSFASPEPHRNPMQPMLRAAQRLGQSKQVPATARKFVRASCRHGWVGLMSQANLEAANGTEPASFYF